MMFILYSLIRRCEGREKKYHCESRMVPYQDYTRDHYWKPQKAREKSTKHQKFIWWVTRGAGAAKDAEASSGMKGPNSPSLARSHTHTKVKAAYHDSCPDWAKSKLDGKKKELIPFI